MNHRISALTVAALAILAAVNLHAQGLRPAAAGNGIGVALPAPALAAGELPADFIVAVVNSEPITNNEVRAAVQQLQQQMAQQGRTVPDRKELTSLVLDRLINEKTQLQSARESGMQIDNAALDQAEQTIARQNRMTVAELRKSIARDAMPPAQFRDQLRDQLLLTRLREREVEPRARVSDQEVDQYLREQQSGSNPAALEINLSQILVAVPESATPEQLAALQTRAQSVLERARKGEDFVALVREFSDAPDRSSGGAMGLRQAERYPPLFVEAVRDLNVGDVSKLLRSDAGFHILKVNEKLNPGLPAATVMQSRARHILLRPSPQMSEAQARQMLGEFKRRVIAGQADFAELARQNSQDASAAQGGDLGWAGPGQYVPEFEEALNGLAPSQISDPVLTRYGVHLIQLTERRTSKLTQQEQREAVRTMLHEKKLDSTYTNWAQDVRGKAYVEMREPPQ